MRLRWMPQARTDLRAIVSYIARDNRDAAERVRRRIMEATSLLLTQPDRGQPGRVLGTRELVVAHTQYIIPYRMREGRVELLAVIHGARQWPESFGE